MTKRRPTLPKIEENLSFLSSQDEKTSSEDENDNDLAAVKETTSKLKLNTRRPSYFIWKQQCLALSSVGNSKHFDDAETIRETESRIESSLEWIRTELGKMQIQDQVLARTFIKLRRDMHQLKLRWSCEDHKELLEDTRQDMQEVGFLNMICDSPLGPFRDENLRKFGVTKMNIFFRRFSTC